MYTRQCVELMLLWIMIDSVTSHEYNECKEMFDMIYLTYNTLKATLSM